jgi:hypothetical protein
VQSKTETAKDILDYIEQYEIWRFDNETI